MARTRRRMNIPYSPYRRRLRPPTPWYLKPFHKLGLYKPPVYGRKIRSGCVSRVWEYYPALQEPPRRRRRERSLSVFSLRKLSSTNDVSDCQSGSRLARLPFEIKQMIWKLCLCDMTFRWDMDSKKIEAVIFYGDAKEKTKRGLLSIPLSCRQLYLETIGMLYSENAFKITADRFLYLDHCILPQRINQICHLRLHWNYDEHPALETEWVGVWENLKRMTGLKSLTIDYLPTSDWEELWSNMESIENARLELSRRLASFEIVPRVRREYLGSPYQ